MCLDPYDDLPDSDDDLAETIPCPQCGAEVYEEAPQCPGCGHYITPDTSPWQGRSVLWIVLGLAGLVAVILVLIGIR